MKRRLCHHDANSLCEFMKQSVPYRASGALHQRKRLHSRRLLHVPVRERFIPPNKKDLPQQVFFVWWEMVDTLRSAFFRTLASVTEKIAVLETSQSQKPIAAFGLLRLNHLRRFSSQYLIKAKEHTIKVCSFTWWEMVDSNHRRLSQQIYSLSPLATREISHIKLLRAGAGGRTQPFL